MKFKVRLLLDTDGIDYLSGQTLMELLSWFDANLFYFIFDSPIYLIMQQ
jgi:hypothetical protein